MSLLHCATVGGMVPRRAGGRVVSLAGCAFCGASTADGGAVVSVLLLCKGSDVGETAWGACVGCARAVEATLCALASVGRRSRGDLSGVHPLPGGEG